MEIDGGDKSSRHCYLVPRKSLNHKQSSSGEGKSFGKRIGGSGRLSRPSSTPPHLVSETTDSGILDWLHGQSRSKGAADAAKSDCAPVRNVKPTVHDPMHPGAKFCCAKDTVSYQLSSFDKSAESFGWLSSVTIHVIKFLGNTHEN